MNPNNAPPTDPAVLADLAARVPARLGALRPGTPIIMCRASASPLDPALGRVGKIFEWPMQDLGYEFVKVEFPRARGGIEITSVSCNRVAVL